MKEIKTQEELKKALKSAKSVVVFGKHDCLHCTIVKNCISSIERHFPLVDFYYTESVGLSDARHINEFPATYFFENGLEIARMIGSKYAIRLRDVLNLWFIKD